MIMKKLIQFINGYAIRFIKNPSEEVQLAAVKESCWSIEYIKNPTEKVKALHTTLWVKPKPQTKKEHKDTKQSKKKSLIESIINTGSFFVIAFLFQYYIMFPQTGTTINIIESFGWTSVYTIGAVLWQFMIRRLVVNKIL